MFAMNTTTSQTGLPLRLTSKRGLNCPFEWDSSLDSAGKPMAKGSDTFEIHISLLYHRLGLE